MKKTLILFVLLFSLSCYAQENLVIDFSINKEKEALYIYIKNNSDSTFIIHNGRGSIHQIWEYDGSRVFISDKKKENYDWDNEMYFPIRSYTGENWHMKKHRPEIIFPNKDCLMDITGIRKGILTKDSVYVRLELYFRSKQIKRIIKEKWVPVIYTH